MECRVKSMVATIVRLGVVLGLPVGAFIAALQGGEAHAGHDWDAVPYFEGCLPIEVSASRGADTLRFGPMKPIGLTDPRTGSRPFRPALRHAWCRSAGGGGGGVAREARQIDRAHADV